MRIDDGVYKTLRKISGSYARKIIEAIKNFASDPYIGDMQKIKGEEFLWRRRIGDYRIFFEIYQEQRRVDVRWIERKTSKT